MGMTSGRQPPRHRSSHPHVEVQRKLPPLGDSQNNQNAEKHGSNFDREKAREAIHKGLDSSRKYESNAPPSMVKAAPKSGRRNSKQEELASALAFAQKENSETRQAPPKESKKKVTHNGPVYGVKTIGGTYGPHTYMGTKVNQDNWFYHGHGDKDSNRDFYVGCLDGHGQSGEKISEFLRTRLGPKGWMAATVEPHRTHDTLKKKHSETAAELRRSGIEVQDSGSTSTSVLRKGDKLWCANVGDSRSVLAQEDATGTLVAIDLSEDQKPDRPDERKRIEHSGGAVEPIRGPPTALNPMGQMMGPARVWRQRQAVGGLAVSRAFGDLAMALVGVIHEPEIKCFQIEETMKFVICASDGVWEYMSSQDAVDVAKQHKDPKKAAAAISDYARRMWVEKGQGYVDDITTVVIKLL